MADVPACCVATHSGCYVEFYRAVAAAIATGAPPPVNPREALDGLKIIEAIYTSAKTGSIIKTFE